MLDNLYGIKETKKHGKIIKKQERLLENQNMMKETKQHGKIIKN